MLVSWRVGLGLIIGCLLIRRVGRQGRRAGLGGGWGEDVQKSLRQMQVLREAVGL